jgi:thiamine pyrophosphokinase
MKYTIIANGTFTPKHPIKAAIKNKTVIALDGAACKLIKYDITPNIILGDFDSLTLQQQTLLGILPPSNQHQDEAPYPGHKDTTIVPTRFDQDHTDLQKACRYAKAQGAHSIDIVCAFDNARLDHNINNLNILKEETTKTCDIRIHSTIQTLIYAANTTITINGRPNDKCGIFSFPKASINSTGLKYECHNSDNSTSNSLQSNSATVNIKGGAIVIMPLQFNP